MLTGITNPLFDKEFLQLLDENRHKEIWAKIISLDVNEQPLEEITGKIVNGGSISLDGTSAVRRTCSFQMVANDVNINSYYWGLKTKFKLYIGLTNDIDEKYDNIIWFPQGIYVISSFSTAQTSNNYSISIQGKDKMCLLNGELGGAITAPTDFGKYDEQTKDENGDIIIITKSIPIRDIIKHALYQYAKEPLHNIIISDLEDYGLQLLNYNFTNPLYMFIEEETGEYLNVCIDGNKTIYLKDSGKSIKLKDIKDDEFNNLSTSLYKGSKDSYKLYSFFSKNEKPPFFSVAKIEYGQTAGYKITDLTYPGDLILNQGEAITSLFDKIIKILGDFEYFYDEQGRFVFQAKKTYIQNTWNQSDGTMVDIENNKYIYEFGKNKLITSFNNNPNLTSVRNDYSIWGTRTGIAGGDIPIHLRYALDYKPYYYKNFKGGVYYTEEFINKNGSLEGINEEALRLRDWRELIYQMAKDYRDNSNDGDFLYKIHKNNIVEIDGEEVILYPSGHTGYEHYYIDIEGFWRQLYNPEYTIEWTNVVSPEPIDNSTSGGDTPIISGDFDSSLTPKEIKVHNYKWIEKAENKKKYSIDQVVVIEEYPGMNNKLNVKPFINDETCALKSELKQGYNYWDKSEEKTLTYEDVKEKNYLTVYVKKGKEILNWVDYVYLEETPVYKTPIDAEGNLYMNFGLFVDPESLSDEEDVFIDLQSLIDSTTLVNKFLRKLYVYNSYYDETKYYRRYHKYIYTRINDGGNGFYDKKEIIKYYTEFDQYNISLKDEDKKKYWNIDVFERPETLNFWFDFMEDMGTISKYSIPAIGHRPKVVNDSGVKSIYFKDTPNVIFEIKKDDPSWLPIDESERKSGYTYVTIPSTMLNAFTASSQGKTAYASLEENLYNNSYCIESASVNIIPIYYLQPNSIIYIRDYDSNINGEYNVSRISVPLSHNGTMSLSLTKVPERIF